MLIMESSTETLTIKTLAKNNDVAVIILLNKNPNFKGFMRPFDLEICGKKMWKYVEIATSEYETKTTFISPETNIVEAIKPMLTNKKYTLVLFGDTPLIQKNTIEEIITFAISRQINAINLPRGYIFDTEYVKTIKAIQNPHIEKFGTIDFMTADNLKNFEKITNIMKNIILDFHLNNGILIQDFNTTFIDADCTLESGVIIKPNNIIKGQTFIGKGTILKSGNIINNSIIKENCIINNSFISVAKIEKGIVLSNKIIDNER